MKPAKTKGGLAKLELQDTILKLQTTSPLLFLISSYHQQKTGRVKAIAQEYLRKREANLEQLVSNVEAGKSAAGTKSMFGTIIPEIGQNPVDAASWEQLEQRATRIEERKKEKRKVGAGRASACCENSKGRAPCSLEPQGCCGRARSRRDSWVCFGGEQVCQQSVRHPMPQGLSHLCCFAASGENQGILGVCLDFECAPEGGAPCGC